MRLGMRPPLGCCVIPGPRETAPVPCLSIRIKGRSRWKDATPACSERPLPASCGAGAGAGLSVSGAKIPAAMNPVGPLEHLVKRSYSRDTRVTSFQAMGEAHRSFSSHLGDVQNDCQSPLPSSITLWPGKVLRRVWGHPGLGGSGYTGRGKDEAERNLQILGKP